MFEKLTTRFGLFKPTENMIGVTKDGKVKMWIN